MPKEFADYSESEFKEGTKMTTTKLFGNELIESIKKEIEHYEELIQNRAERIELGMTDMDDCFLSEKVEQSAITEAKMQLEILSGDGCEERDVVIDEDGEDVGARWVQTRYGSKVVARGIFANSIKALCKKTGWTEAKRRIPVWTKWIPCGYGLAGAYSGYYAKVRWHTNMKTGEYVGFPE